MTAPLRVALVGGPMYDHLYDAFAPGEVEVVVHADHPTLNREVAHRLATGSGSTCARRTRSTRRRSRSGCERSTTSSIPAWSNRSRRGRSTSVASRARSCALPRLIDVRVLWTRHGPRLSCPRHLGGAGRVRGHLRFPRTRVGPVRHVLRARRRLGRDAVRRAAAPDDRDARGRARDRSAVPAFRSGADRSRRLALRPGRRRACSTAGSTPRPRGRVDGVRFAPRRSPTGSRHTCIRRAPCGASPTQVAMRGPSRTPAATFPARSRSWGGSSARRRRRLTPPAGACARTATRLRRSCPTTTWTAGGSRSRVGRSTRR